MDVGSAVYGTPEVLRVIGEEEVTETIKGDEGAGRVAEEFGTHSVAHEVVSDDSTSLWEHIQQLQLTYIKVKGRVSKGNRVWQIALKSGFKCNTAVWKAVRDMLIIGDWQGNPWDDSVDKYPVNVPTAATSSSS
ncbi:putative 3-ketoacyl-CoA synthase 1 isoform X1 [Sesbania bispinosa]|nr:putative 3-ketoacyl-CoA synthase 1 isoform X1 [Sesbania bispinosa]